MSRSIGSDGDSAADGADTDEVVRTMSPPSHWTEEHQLAALAAPPFYHQDVPKVAIADELGISRFKVARLLELARDSGIVTIEMHDAGVPDDRLSQELCDHLRLDECIVVNSRGSEDDIREQIATVGAHFLESNLHEGDVLGLAWGRTLGAMTRHLGQLPAITILQLNGAASSQPENSPVDVVRRASLRSGGAAHAFFLPLVVHDEHTAAVLRSQPDVAATMRLFDDLDIAMVSLGSWVPPSSQIHDNLETGERDHLLAKGVQADLACTLLDSDGNVVDGGYIGRSISIRHEQLRAVPRVIALAGGTIKAAAALAAARSGLMTGLITDRSLAEAVLAMPFASSDQREADKAVEAPTSRDAPSGA
jgi:DNA-binding transcriptional regulator LsrR (DeoR family)